MGSPAVQLKELTFAYPGEAFTLRIPELEVEREEHLALIGPSGCGKTTLAGLIAGILTPTSGQLNVLDQEITRLNDAARRAFRIRHIGFVFQEFELLDYLNGQQNILLPYSIHPEIRLDARVQTRLTNLAKAAGVAHLLKRFPRHMSQGERQRMAICRALITEPDILIADEPTGNLDPENSHSIMEHMHRSSFEHHTTLIAITHDHSLLDRFDRALDLSKEFRA